jgi:hypothetical protein
VSRPDSAAEHPITAVARPTWAPKSVPALPLSRPGPPRTGPHRPGHGHGHGPARPCPPPPAPPQAAGPVSTCGPAPLRALPPAPARPSTAPTLARYIRTAWPPPQRRARRPPCRALSSATRRNGAQARPTTYDPGVCLLRRLRRPLRGPEARGRGAPSGQGGAEPEPGASLEGVDGPTRVPSPPRGDRCGRDGLPGSAPYLDLQTQDTLKATS